MELFIGCLLSAALGAIPHVYLVCKCEDGILGMGDYRHIWDEFPWRWDQVVFAELCTLVIVTALFYLIVLATEGSPQEMDWLTVLGFAFFSALLHIVGVWVFYDKTAYGQRLWWGPLLRPATSRWSRSLAFTRAEQKKRSA